MARGHGRILTPIWEDTDFLALTQEQQRLYLFLISQPNLNHAGLLPLTLRRWARKAAGLTAAVLENHLDALDRARFIVIDEDTEELLIRSFVRNDGVWKQPKVMGAMVSGAMEISSRALRRALLDEMDRIPLDELSDEPTKIRNVEGPSIRRQVADHIETLRKAFGDPNPTPGQGASRTPSAPPSGTPSEPPSEGASETHDEGRPKASTRVGACAHTARVPLPLPLPHPLSPAPSPDPSVRRGEGSERGDRSSAREPQNALSLIPADWTPNDTDRAAAAADLTRLGDKAVSNATAKFIRHHQGLGTRRVDFGPAWVTWLTRERADTQGAFLVGLPGGSTPTPPSFAERMAELDAAAARDDRDHNTA